MKERIEKELELIRTFFPDIKYSENGHWFYIPSYTLPDRWNRSKTEIAFQIKNGYPATKPYAFYVPEGLLYNEQTPKNYKPSANNQPPFEGTWGQLSWTISSPWKPTADITKGSNLLNWILSFENRFKEGA